MQTSKDMVHLGTSGEFDVELFRSKLFPALQSNLVDSARYIRSLFDKASWRKNATDEENWSAVEKWAKKKQPCSNPDKESGICLRTAIFIVEHAQEEYLQTHAADEITACVMRVAHGMPLSSILCLKMMVSAAINFYSRIGLFSQKMSHFFLWRGAGLGRGRWDSEQAQGSQNTRHKKRMHTIDHMAWLDSVYGTPEASGGLSYGEVRWQAQYQCLAWHAMSTAMDVITLVSSKGLDKLSDAFDALCNDSTPRSGAQIKHDKNLGK